MTGLVPRHRFYDRARSLLSSSSLVPFWNCYFEGKYILCEEERGFFRKSPFRLRRRRRNKATMAAATPTTYVRTTRAVLGYCTTKKEGSKEGEEKEVLGWVEGRGGEGRVLQTALFSSSDAYLCLCMREEGWKHVAEHLYSDTLHAREI